MPSNFQKLSFSVIFLVESTTNFNQWCSQSEIAALAFLAPTHQLWKCQTFVIGRNSKNVTCVTFILLFGSKITL